MLAMTHRDPAQLHERTNDNVLGTDKVILVPSERVAN